MSAKQLAIAAPGLCRVPNAARWARIAEFVWVDEGSHPKSVFSRTEEDAKDEAGRLTPLFGWVQEAADSGKAMYITTLFELLMDRHYVKDHGRNDLMDRAAFLEGYLRPVESKYPDVSALLTVDQAVAGFWT